MRFSVQACDGLAHAIDKTTEEPLPATAAQALVQALCARYVAALGPCGTQPGQIDTVVLGCTHYVFARDMLQALVGPQVQLIDTGAAVARHTRQVLAAAHALAPEAGAPGRVALFTTGPLAALQAAAERWLALPGEHCAALPAL